MKLDYSEPAAHFPESAMKILREGLPFRIEQGDITKYKVDAIVNAANSSLRGGGGVDGAIHRAAGPELLKECRTLGGCETGNAKITKGYNLPAKYVIHTVGPIFSESRKDECRILLENCFKNSLALAIENGCKSIAFPLISAGVYGYPKEEALDVAIHCITNFSKDLKVFLVLFDAEAYKLAKRNYSEYVN